MLAALGEEHMVKHWETFVFKMSPDPPDLSRGTIAALGWAVMVAHEWMLIS